ncbi:MAG: hypothetical protein ACRBBM_01415 [Pseudomonadaceae bacterium]|jgi:hypothetical protein
MIRFIGLIAVLIIIAGCSDDNGSASSQAASANQVVLPEDASERVSLTGEMSFWMYEGAAGCYGTLVSQGEEVQVWVDADSCGDREYEENQSATLELTFDPENQYGPGKTYTITSFE